jgi:hypothetical protein
MKTITITKPITKVVSLTLNGFHGYQSHNVRASFTHRDAIEGYETPYGYAEGEKARYEVAITESAAQKFACNMSDCRCGEGIPTEFPCDEYEFENRMITLNGNYPQR